MYLHKLNKSELRALLTRKQSQIKKAQRIATFSIGHLVAEKLIALRKELDAIDYYLYKF